MLAAKKALTSGWHPEDVWQRGTKRIEHTEGCCVMCESREGVQKRTAVTVPQGECGRIRG